MGEEHGGGEGQRPDQREAAALPGTGQVPGDTGPASTAADGSPPAEPAPPAPEPDQAAAAPGDVPCDDKPATAGQPAGPAQPPAAPFFRPGYQQPGTLQDGRYPYPDPQGSVYPQGSPPGGYTYPQGGYAQPGHPYGRYGQPPGDGGYGPPGGYGYPPDYIQQSQPGRKRWRSVATYIAVAAVFAGIGAGTVLAVEHTSSPSASANTQPNDGGSSNFPGFFNPFSGSGSSGSGSAVSSAILRSVARAVEPGVVDITSSLRYEGGTAAATGIVISSSGLVLTNNHVINGTTGLTARLVSSGHTYPARWLGYDKADDVAVLQLEGASGLRTAPLGNSATVRIGDKVVAIGNAGGVGGFPKVVGGTITGIDQTITASDEGSADHERLHDMLQTDANIVPGDSGGPLATAAGKVIGLDTAALEGNAGSQSAQGFAIPIDRAMSIARQIIAGHASSTIQIGGTGFLGVLVPSGNASKATSPQQQRRLQIQADQAGGFGGRLPPAGLGCMQTEETVVPAKVAPTSAGSLIVGVLCGTAADSAGIVAGDVIIAVDGRTVTSPDSLTTVMQAYRPGNRVTVTWVDTSGQRHSGTLDLGQKPPE
jgi:S1-C subfamily serine protease